MQEKTGATPIVYTLKQRLLINLGLATVLLLLAQLNWVLAEPSFWLGGLIYLITLIWALPKAPRPQINVTIDFRLPHRPKFSQSLAVDELHIYWLMIVASLVLGVFYAFSFIRFLNAHNGLTMFMVWQGLE